MNAPAGGRYRPSPPAPARNVLAIVALVLALVALVVGPVAWFSTDPLLRPTPGVLGGLLALVALVLAVVALMGTRARVRRPIALAGLAAAVVVLALIPAQVVEANTRADQDAAYLCSGLRSGGGLESGVAVITAATPDEPTDYTLERAELLVDRQCPSVRRILRVYEDIAAR